MEGLDPAAGIKGTEKNIGDKVKKDSLMRSSWSGEFNK